MNKFLGSIVEVTFYLNPVYNKVTLGFFDISINIKFENLARKLSFFQIAFTINEFETNIFSLTIEDFSIGRFFI